MSKEVIIKINSIGTFSVGKTSLIRRYADNTFFEDYLPTLGVDITVKRGLVVGDKQIRLVFMDTAGEEKFGNLRKTYFEGSQGCIAVYDITRADTLNDLDHWLKEYRTAAGDDRCITIIGNKIDLVGRRVVAEKEGRRYARSKGTDFSEASAKFGGKDLTRIFEDLMKKCLTKISG